MPDRHGIGDLESAWEAIHAATPPGWYLRRPGQRHGGRRSREWTAVGMTEVECLLEMARCLREIGEERVPTSKVRLP
ncbi:MAG: hypothetical protein ABIP53_10520 [Candidatus Limnocylindrales bacterium]